jgi:hypothetical protein
MNTTLKFGLMAAMMTSAVLAVSGTATAIETLNVGDDFAIRGVAVGSHYCTGIVDSNCTCRNNVSYCQEGDPCSTYIDYTCVVGGGGLYRINSYIALK